jgi:hypothetical protein
LGNNLCDYLTSYSLISANRTLLGAKKQRKINDGFAGSGFMVCPKKPALFEARRAEFAGFGQNRNPLSLFSRSRGIMQAKKIPPLETGFKPIINEVD